MTFYGGIAAFLASFALATIGALFAVAHRFGLYPPLRSALATWGVATVLSISIAIVIVMLRKAGRWDLTIDHNFGVVILPAAKGRAPGQRVLLSDAGRVDIEDVAQTDDNSQQWRLQLETHSGPRYLPNWDRS